MTRYPGSMPPAPRGVPARDRWFDSYLTWPAILGVGLLSFFGFGQRVYSALVLGLPALVLVVGLQIRRDRANVGADGA
jgi:hypothetical protein